MGHDKRWGETKQGNTELYMTDMTWHDETWHLRRHDMENMTKVIVFLERTTQRSAITVEQVVDMELEGPPLYQFTMDHPMEVDNEVLITLGEQE